MLPYAGNIEVLNLCENEDWLTDKVLEQIGRNCKILQKIYLADNDFTVIGLGMFLWVSLNSFLLYKSLYFKALSMIFLLEKVDDLSLSANAILGIDDMVAINIQIQNG